MSLDIKVDTSQLNAVFERLIEQAPELVRPVAQSGAQVVYEETKRILRQSLAQPTYNGGSKKRPYHLFYGTSYKKHNGPPVPADVNVPGRYKFMRGTLEKSIYQTYSADNSNSAKATYHVSWRMTGGPGNKELPSTPYGLFVEYGLSPIAKSHKPFLTQAADNVEQGVVDAMSAKLMEAFA